MSFFSEEGSHGKSQVTWQETCVAGGSCVVLKNTGSNQLSQAVVARLQASGCRPSGARPWTVMLHSVRRQAVFL